MTKKLIVKRPTIYMDGGLIQGVEGFPPNWKFDIIDYDLGDGPEPIEICKCKAGDGEHFHRQTITNSEGKE